ncbi:M81 family metallopeptidase [Paenirhodobacter enshiensis]|uniref:M81 family metallopeptidase n=1 Tax=Paenirhodobacter enshiensis TaxID=1105367 RepID=UPI003FA1ED8A
MRIVFAGFQHETNTFSADVADDAAFAHGGGFPGLCRGAEVTERAGPGADIPGAGFLAPAPWTPAFPGRRGRLGASLSGCPETHVPRDRFALSARIVCPNWK